jgi:hypothetical protein
VEPNPPRSWGMAQERTGKLCLREDRRLELSQIISGHVLSYVPRGMFLTNEEEKPFGWSFNPLNPLHLERSHARHNGTDKVDIEYRVDIHHMEEHGNGQESKASNSSHG